ncbi:MAG: cytochrome-c peroxidase [Nitrospinota bacterium]|nr:cytochrome-c peroxidase [Nitrospinota bacterium]
MKKVIFIIAAVCFVFGTVLEAGAGRLPQPVGDQHYVNNGSFDPQKVQLGKFLFFDKILSGNQNISCATCHFPSSHTSDGLTLPIGEGARGLSVTRDTGTGPDAVHERVPRNSPSIFNSGAREFDKMFHDGRVAVNAAAPSGFDSPAGPDLPSGLENLLAAQAMFPVTSGTEMAGQAGENTIADAAAANNLAGPGGVWEQLALRLQAIPEYVDLFKAVYSDVHVAGDITYVHAANAIGTFEASDWRADNSPFDRFLRGTKDALSPEAKRGMRLFYGQAGCSSCHSGLFQTDQQFHAIAMPQVGPGKGDNQPGYADGHDDFGRERVTGDAGDRFKFRTPSLRNIELTAPYGHAGAYDALQDVVRHHLDPVDSLFNYDQSQVSLPSRPDLDAQDFVVMNDPARLQAIADANELPAQKLREKSFADLMAFLRSLTDPDSVDLRKDVPPRVPSGLPVFD